MKTEVVGKLAYNEAVLPLRVGGFSHARGESGREARTERMASMTTLFVNACMRGERSRTLGLCREYLAATGDDVVEVNLAALELRPFDAQMVEERTAKQTAGAWDDPIFALSRQFAEADDIVIGAPYWDLSFPAALKTYFEHVSVCELTFHYTEDARCEGLARARRITYITTCGGLVGKNMGFEYVEGIAEMFGIPEVRCVKAENLDVVGADVEAELDRARAQMRSLL